jgi:hypothetical protein
VHEEHRRNVATWWSEVFGGPPDYTEDLGGYERMLHKHLQLGITEEQRFRFASLIPSFDQRWWRISNGAPAWPWGTHKTAPR